MKARKPLVKVQSGGLYCPAGDFFIDPWRAVDKAVITHAHSDHARWGSKQYIAAEPCVPLLQHRLGTRDEVEQPINARGIPYGQQFVMNDALVSFHSAGHILGSAQVRIEVDGEVWVVTGDYKRETDPTCDPFEVVPCDVLITEATFGLPIYKWDSGAKVAEEIFQWWHKNREQNRTSLLFCYALGKAQRVLGELAKLTDRPVYVHGAVHQLTELYRKQGIEMLPTEVVTNTSKKNDLAGELVLAPPSAFRSPWMKRFKDFETGFASGWMRVRAARRHRSYDRGFVLSDHTDWPGILKTIEETGAKRVFAMHGRTEPLVRYLNGLGYQADSMRASWWDEEAPEEDSLNAEQEAALAEVNKNGQSTSVNPAAKVAANEQSPEVEPAAEVNA